jgi:hypothetical protein
MHQKILDPILIGADLFLNTRPIIRLLLSYSAPIFQNI